LASNSSLHFTDSDYFTAFIICMQVCETFLSKKWQTVMWHRECEQSIHV